MTMSMSMLRGKYRMLNAVVLDTWELRATFVVKIHRGSLNPIKTAPRMLPACCGCAKTPRTVANRQPKKARARVLHATMNMRSALLLRELMSSARERSAAQVADVSSAEAWVKGEAMERLSL